VQFGYRKGGILADELEVRYGTSPVSRASFASSELNECLPMERALFQRKQEREGPGEALYRAREIADSMQCKRDATGGDWCVLRVFATRNVLKEAVKFILEQRRMKPTEKKGLY